MTPNEQSKIPTKNIIFLLGGADLEMDVIRTLLREHGYREVDSSNYRQAEKGYVDKLLAWGASVTDYEEFFDFPGRIYGIELSEPPGWKAPANYKSINHHNELSYLPASIEQIAALLGVELSRRQKLVAANDKGYIPAMKEMGATDDEIAQVRQADRRAQGVTEEDEKKAEESIDKNLVWNNGIAVIKSLTDKFSPVTDRMFGKAKSLLIYTDKEITYFGAGVEKLSKHFQDYINKGFAYSGGGENGFFGFAENSLSHEEIKEKIEKIKTLITGE